MKLAGHPREILGKLMAHPTLPNHPMAKPALEDMSIIVNYLDAMGCIDDIDFDLSLARGLDYYTGVIYEAVLMGTVMALQLAIRVVVLS